jgi:hypothetical protein
MFCCRGHGTQVVDGKLMATLCGVIEVQSDAAQRPCASRRQLLPASACISMQM